MSDILESTKKRMSKQHDIEECHKVLGFFEVPQSYHIYAIMKYLEMPKDKVKTVLSVLLRFALIYNFYIKNSYNEDFSRYELSKLGKAYKKRFKII